MKKIISIFVGIFLTAGAALAQSSDVATNTARAGIITPLSISKTRDISFGVFTVPSVQSVIRIGANNAAPIVLSGESPKYIEYPKTALVTISGQPGASVTYAFSGVTQLTSAGGDTLNVIFRIGSSVGASATTTINPDGTKIVYGGGDLTIGPDQATGTYSGSYMVTVSYN